MRYSAHFDDGDLSHLPGVLPGVSAEEPGEARRVQAQREAYAETLSSLARIGEASRSKRSKAGAVTLDAWLPRRRLSAVAGNRLSGRVLWVVDKPPWSRVLPDLRGQGIEFEYAASGGMATEHRAARWTRTWGRPLSVPVGERREQAGSEERAQRADLA